MSPIAQAVSQKRSLVGSYSRPSLFVLPRLTCLWWRALLVASPESATTGNCTAVAYSAGTASKTTVTTTAKSISAIASYSSDASGPLLSVYKRVSVTPARSTARA